MDTKDLRGLMEAYTEVYAPQEVDEAVKGADLEMRKAASVERRGGDKPLPKKEGEKFAKFKASQISYIDKKTKGKYIHGMTREEFDIFDIVLEFLQVEGYAETLEEAEWLMANELDAEDIEAILEAEGSYGQTPKARTAMGKLEVSRRTKPVGEYSQRGEKTRKVKAAEKHNRRMDSGPDVGNRGKRSTSPRWSGYKGATGRGKMDQDSRDWSRERDVEYSAGENKPGSGSVTKNPKKLRKQKAMGEHD